MSSFGIQVLGMDNIGYKFYYFEDAAPLEYYSSLYDRFREKINNNNIQIQKWYKTKICYKLPLQKGFFFAIILMALKAK